MDIRTEATKTMAGGGEDVEKEESGIEVQVQPSLEHEVATCVGWQTDGSSSTTCRRRGVGVIYSSGDRR